MLALAGSTKAALSHFPQWEYDVLSLSAAKPVGSGCASRDDTLAPSETTNVSELALRPTVPAAVASPRNGESKRQQVGPPTTSGTPTAVARVSEARGAAASVATRKDNKQRRT